MSSSTTTTTSIRPVVGSRIPFAFPRVTSLVRISREFYSNFVFYDSTSNTVNYRNNSINDKRSRSHFSFCGSNISSFICDCEMSQHYDGFDNSAVMRTFHEFVSFDEFMNVVQRMRRINYSVRAVRNQIISMVDGLPKQRLINKNRRFPADGYYVDITSGVMADLLDSAILSLDFGEKLLQHAESHGVDDGKLSYMHSVKRMLTITMAANGEALAPFGIYNRESIEKCLHITWVGSSSLSNNLNI